MTEIVAWHASAEEELVVRSGLHVGTLAQAVMRGGRHLHRVVIDTGSRMPRLRDRGSWDPRTLRRHARRSAVAVYLNRHEGIPLEEFERARGSIDLDAATDARFHRSVPAAADSWIVLDVSAVKRVDRIEDASSQTRKARDP